MNTLIFPDLNILNQLVEALELIIKVIFIFIRYYFHNSIQDSKIWHQQYITGIFYFWTLPEDVWNKNTPRRSI